MRRKSLLAQPRFSTLFRRRISPQRNSNFNTQWNKLRENLFTYQESRRHVMEIQKRCSEQSYSLVKAQPSILDLDWKIQHPTGHAKRPLPSARSGGRVSPDAFYYFPRVWSNPRDWSSPIWPRYMGTCGISWFIPSCGLSKWWTYWWIVSTQGFVPKMLESLRGLSCGLVGQNSNQTVRFHTPKPRITNFGPT
jgi:hypothetical protein